MKFQFEEQEDQECHFNLKNKIEHPQTITHNQKCIDIQKQITNVDEFLNNKLKNAIQINKFLKKQTRILNFQAQNLKEKQQKVSKTNPQQKASQKEIGHQNNVEQKQRSGNLQSQAKSNFNIQKNKKQNLDYNRKERVKQAKQQLFLDKNIAIKNTIMSLGYPSVQKNAILGFKTNKMPYRFNRFS